jgi:uncharacterized MnhB-related membrane protein
LVGKSQGYNLMIWFISPLHSLLILCQRKILEAEILEWKSGLYSYT